MGVMESEAVGHPGGVPAPRDLIDQHFPRIRWTRSSPHGRVSLPQMPGDAGFDLTVAEDVSTKVRPVLPIKVPLGVRVALPEGWFGMLLGRSSALTHWRLQVLPSVIDAGFRGELFALVVPLFSGSVHIPAGVRLCQLVPLPISGLGLQQNAELPPSMRGDRGFGSTGGTTPQGGA